MNYERLTKKCDLGIGLTRTSGNITEDYIAVVNRLAELEDMIEDGRLIELPCKVGDKLYWVSSSIKKPEEWEIIDIAFYGEITVTRRKKSQKEIFYFYSRLLGEEWFTTKPEAEAKLKELRGKQ